MVNLKSKQKELVKSKLQLNSGDWISCKEFKDKLQSIYNELNIKQIVKFTDIYNFYDYKNDYRIENGLKINGYIIK